MKQNVAKKVVMSLGALALLLGVPDLTMGTGAPSPVPRDLGDGLVGHWKLEDGSGTTATDDSGEGNDGTLQNSPSWVDGYAGKALSFTKANNERVEVSDSASLSITGAFTLAAWIKPTLDTSDQMGIIEKWDSGTKNGYFMRLNGSRRINCQVMDGSGGESKVGDSTVALDEWSHVAAIYDGTSIRIYLNGVLDGTKQVSTTPTDGTRHLEIGRDYGGNRFEGEIDDVRVYDRAIGEGELSEIITDAGLVARWRLDDNTGTTASDSSEESNDGTLTNGPTWKDAKIGKGLGLVKTDNEYVDVPDSSSLSITGPFTLSAWIKPTLDTTDQMGIIEKWDSGSTNGYYLRLNSSRKVVCQIFDGSGSESKAGSTTISLNQWTHVAGVYDGSTITIYVGGTSDGSGSVTKTPTDGTRDLHIGNDYGGNRFEGDLDEVRVYNRALSASEVSDLLEANGKGLTAVHYDNDTWTGSFVERIDTEVDFDWGAGSPDASIGNDTFSSVWTGQVLARYTETYTFYANTDDGARLWVDGELVIDNPIDQSETEVSGTIALTAGERYDIKFETHENTGSAVSELRWSSSTQSKEIVPQSQLFTQDDSLPQLVSATADSGDLTKVYLRFSERMDRASTQFTGNYTLSGGLSVNAASLSDDKKVVTLTASGNVTLGTTTVEGSKNLADLSLEGMIKTKHTIVAGNSEGIPDTDAITLSLSTDDNECAILWNENQKITLTVTAPGTTATTVDLSQMKAPGGKSFVFMGTTGSDLSAQVTTAGGGTNTATIKLRGKDFGAFQDDAELIASVDGEERGFKDFTVVKLAFSPNCVYGADQRATRQSVQTTPAIESLQLLTTSKLQLAGLASATTTLLAAPQFPETDTAGSATRQFTPRALDYYVLNDERLDTSSAEDDADGSPYTDYTDDGPNESPCGPDCDPGEKGGTSEPCQCGSSDDTNGGMKDSVDISDGEKKLNLTDLSIRGRGIHYSFRRVYRGHNYRGAIGDHGDFGENWTYSYADDFLVSDGSDSTAPILHFQAGQANTTYIYRGTVSAWQPTRELFTHITRNTNPQPDVFELRNKDGMVRTYHDFSDTSTPNKNGRLKEIRDRNDNFMSFLYDEIDPDGTASNGDEKFVLTRVIDSMGREIRYEYYAATAQSSGGHTLTIVETGTGARGRLARVRDFKGDMDFSDADASEDFPNQVNNRTLHFDYDSEGNLIRASRPAVGGTPTSNDFANGKTFRYKYIVESDLSTLVTNWASLTNDQKDVVRSRLLHKMTHIWYPNEVKNTPGANPADADAAEILTYNTTATFDPATSTMLAQSNFLGFVTEYTIGGQNGNGVPSGGTIEYTYTDLNPDKDMPGGVSTDLTKLLDIQNLKVEVTDRNGNEAEYIWGGGRTLLEYREKTSGLRTGEPANYLLTLEHQGDRFLGKRTWPEGNTSEFTFNDTSTDRFQQGNLIRRIETPDVTRGADQDKIEVVFVYEPIYNRPCLVVQARGSDIDNNGFTPPISDPVDRTMTDPYDATKTLDLRYARVEYFDYQESTEKAMSAPDTRLDKDGSGGKVNQSPLITYDADVLTTEVWLVQELGLAETTTGGGLDELRDRLSDNLTNLGLGDLNGDNDTTPTIAGNIIRTVFGSPVIVANTNQDSLESTIESAGDLIDETKTYGQGGTNESSHGGRLQTIVWMYRYNALGQVIQSISPEGNVETHEYFAENDPDGDTTTTPTPPDSRTLDTTTGGYLKKTVRDRTRTDADVKYLDQSGTNKDTATFHNNNTAPTDTDITSSYTYDDVGNTVTMTDPRGIRGDYFVNELDQVVRTTLAADISGASSADPSDPLVGASIGALTAFAYKSRTYLDFNDQVVLSQLEDRGNTSSVDGSGLGTLPSQATDTTPGLSTADSTGGDAYVDGLTLFDRLNNPIESRAEVDSSMSLNTMNRYDGNQHLVLRIYPEGNADSWVYDERELLFQAIRGASTRPTAGKYAAGDPSTFDRPGGSGTTTSILTYNYDKNRNLVEFVDSEDTDSSSVNGSSIAGSGDVTAYTYDGYDRRKSIRDATGNEITYLYDPDFNVERAIQRGDPVDDLVPGSFPDSANRTLTVLETVYDALSRPTVSHQVLFQTPVASPTRTPTLTDGTSMDALAAYLADASSDTASAPGVTDITVIGRVSVIQEYDRESRSTFMVQDELDTYRMDYDGVGRVVRTMDSALATGFATGGFTPANQKGNVVVQSYDDMSNVVEIREFDVMDLDANGVADYFDANHDGIVNTSDTVLDFDLDGTADADAEVFRTTLLYDSLNRPQTSVDNVAQTLDLRHDSRSNAVAEADAQGPISTRSILRRWENPFDATDTDTASVTVNSFGNVTRARFDGISRYLEIEAILTASGQGDGTNVGATLEGVQAMSGGDVDYSDVPTRDSNQSSDGLLSVYYAYDDNSQLLGFRDDNGNTTVYIYDNQERTLTERKGLAETGASFTITGGDSGSFVVALRGGTAPVDTEASGTDIDYTYDKDSNTTQIVDEATNTLSYTFDALDRRKTLAITKASGFSGTSNQTWEYDGLSRLGECTDDNDAGTGDDVTCRYFFDSLSRKTEEGLEIGAGNGFRDISCSYDIATSGAVWLPSQCTYPDGRKVDSTYDDLDRLVSRTDNGGAYSPIGAYAYIGRGRVATLTYHNDTRLTHIGQTTANAQEGFDDLRRVTKHRWESFTAPDTTPGNDTLLVGFGHEFGTVGSDGRATPAYDRMNSKLIEEKLHDGNSSEVYAYDSSYRLTLPTSTYRSPAPANAYQRGTLNANRDNISTLTTRPGQRQKDDWTLDGTGNWASNPYTDQGTAAVTETRDHTDFNEINQRTISTDNTTHTLDKNGNITDTGQDVGTGGSRFFAGGMRAEWDVLNRLRKIYYNANTPGSTGDDTLIAEYSYDCANRRVRRVFTNNTTALNGTTEYFYEGWRVLEEQDGSGGVLQQYVYGHYLDELWTLDDRRGAGSVGDLNDGSGNDRRFYHYNTLYSVFALTDESGSIEEAYQYNAFGTPTVWSGAGTDGMWFTNDDVQSTTTNGAPLSAIGNPYLYTGQRLDPMDLPETALQYYKNRFYSHDLGRFLSRDVIGSDNLYAYVTNAPISWVDPYGLRKEACFDGTCGPKGKNSCQKVQRAYYYDNRSKADRERDAALESTARMPFAETARRFLESQAGKGNVFGMTSITDLAGAGSKCKKCECIDKLYILGHGWQSATGVGTGVFGAGVAGFTIVPEAEVQAEKGRTKMGVSSWSALGKALNPHMCDPCEIWLIACNIGDSASAAELANASGCTVVSFGGTWSITPSGTLIPRDLKSLGNNQWEAGPSQRAYQTKPGGKPVPQPHPGYSAPGFTPRPGTLK